MTPFNYNPRQKQSPNPFTSQSQGGGFFSDWDNNSKTDAVEQPFHMGYWLLKELANNGAIGSQFGRLGAAGDQYEQYRQQALRGLTPAGIQNMIQQFSRQQMGAAGDQGRENAMNLRSRGYAGNADLAGMLSARNNAARSSNQYAENAMSPQAQMQRAQAGMQLNSPEAVASILPMLLQLMNAQVAQDSSRAQINKSQEGQSGLGMIGGLLGNIAGGLDWTKILGMGGK